MSVKLENTRPIKSVPKFFTETGKENLPNDLTDLIFASLNMSDLHTPTCVCKEMKSYVVEHIFFDVNTLLQSLIKNLGGDDFTEQRKRLTEISKDKTSQNMAYLRSLRRGMFHAKEELIDVLKTLDDAKISDLKRRVGTLPRSMENLFEMPAIYRRLDQAKLEENENARDLELSRIAETLAEHGNEDKALEVTGRIKNIFRDYPLQRIPIISIRFGKIDQAFRVAKILSDESFIHPLLFNMCDVLIKRKNIDKAVEAARMISDDFGQATKLRDILKVLVEEKNFNKALEIAGMVPRKEVGWVLGEICRDLTELGCIDEAIKFTEMIPENCWFLGMNNRNANFLRIGIALAKSGNIDKAVEVAKMCSEDEKNHALLQICFPVAGLGSISKALEIAEMISNERFKSIALKAISNALVERGQAK